MPQHKVTSRTEWKHYAIKHKVVLNHLVGFAFLTTTSTFFSDSHTKVKSVYQLWAFFSSITNMSHREGFDFSNAFTLIELKVKLCWGFSVPYFYTHYKKNSWRKTWKFRWNRFLFIFSRFFHIKIYNFQSHLCFDRWS